MWTFHSKLSIIFCLLTMGESFVFFLPLPGGAGGAGGGGGGGSCAPEVQAIRTEFGNQQSLLQDVRARVDRVFDAVGEISQAVPSSIEVTRAPVQCPTVGPTQTRSDPSIARLGAALVSGLEDLNSRLDTQEAAFTARVDALESKLDQSLGSIASSVDTILKMNRTCEPVALEEEFRNETVASEYFDLMDRGRREWRLVFRATAGINKSVYRAYTARSPPTNVEPGCKQLDGSKPCTFHYVSPGLADWFDIREVAFVLLKNGQIRKRIIFNGNGSNRMNFFSKANIVFADWSDLQSQSQNVFSIRGQVQRALARRFFISKNTQNCRVSSGWVEAVDVRNQGCTNERRGTFPTFLYSSTDTLSTWASDNIERADVMAIFVKYF